MSTNTTGTGLVIDSTLDYFQVACASMAIYNAIEVLALALTSFRKYNTLYFWSIMVCASGVILFAVGFLDLFYNWYVNDGVTIYRPLFILTFGWYGMVTGFAVVMWSRLHIVNVPKKYIRIMKFMICYNVVFSHFPTTVMTFGANVVDTYEWVYGYAVIEKIQMTFFCIQEVCLGALYLHYTARLRLSHKNTALVRKTLYINSFVLFLDVSMLLVEYIGLYNYQIMLKCVVYSIKLKLEFYILTILSRSVENHTLTDSTPAPARVASGMPVSSFNPAVKSQAPQSAVVAADIVENDDESKPEKMTTLHNIA